jgi:ribosomal-protein-alanine N-acetyltransferase
MMLLATRRLLLRDFVEDDWAAVLEYQSDPRYLRYYAWTERNEADVRALLRRWLDWQEQAPRTRWQLAITLPEQGGRLIGICGIRQGEAPADLFGQRETRSADVGYELDPRYWGKGYATEAAREIVRFGFENLGLHRIWAQCIADNIASARVMERLGMRLEGRTREDEWFKGRWWDHLTYAILEKEWGGDRGSAVVPDPSDISGGTN